MNDQEIQEKVKEMLLKFLERATTGANNCSEAEIQIIPAVAEILYQSVGGV